MKASLKRTLLLRMRTVKVRRSRVTLTRRRRTMSLRKVKTTRTLISSPAP